MDIIKIFINSIAYLLQTSLIVGALILQILSTKKMGVARYLVYRNSEFEASIFSPNMMLTYKVLTVVAAIAVIILIIKNYTGKRHIYIKATVVINLVIIAFSGYYTFFSDSTSVRALYFLLIALYFNVVIQFIRSYFVSKK